MPLSGDRPDPDCARNYFALHQNTFAGAMRLKGEKKILSPICPSSAKLILSLLLSVESANLTKAFSHLND